MNKGTSKLDPTATPIFAPAATMERPTPTRAKTKSDQFRADNSAKKFRSVPSGASHKHFTSIQPRDDASNSQAELFYLQKQIQLQTPMVFILEDGAKVQGIVEWYDKHSIKVRGKSRVLIYKSAIKYLYKAGEVGAAPQK